MTGGVQKTMGKKTNPRYANGNYRRGVRARFKAMGLPCHICGREIDYSLPYLDPMSFVVDEIKPISKWKQFGYDSPEAVARDPDNLAPAHRICNAQKGAKVGYRPNRKKYAAIPHNGSW